MDTEAHTGDAMSGREAGTGVMPLQTKECQGWPQPPDTRKERIPSGIS